MKRCALICNLHSGKGLKHKVLDQAIALIESYNYEIEVYFTKYTGHARELALKLKDIDLVLSFGGDGTFNEVLSGNIKRKDKITLAHIPLGTTNDIGLMFGLNKDILGNLRMVLDGEVKDIDVCTINNVPFFYVAGFGKFMNIPYETPRNLKKMFGYLAYLIEGIKNLNKPKLFELKYKVNNEEYVGLYSFGVVSSATRIAGVNNIYKDVLLNDKNFEVLLCNLTKKKDIIKTLYYLKTTNDITKVPGFYFIRTDEIKIKFTDELKKPWCIDGERLKSTRKEFTIKTDKTVPMLVPKKIVNKLFI